MQFLHEILLTATHEPSTYSKINVVFTKQITDLLSKGNAA